LGERNGDRQLQFVVRKPVLKPNRLDFRTEVRVYSARMRIGEVARRAGVHVETLRYYERRGLLAEPARTPFGHRSYGEETVRFVRAVKEAQGLGFTLAEIEEYLRLARPASNSPSESMRVLLAAKIDEIDAKIASLRRVRADLSRVLGCACDSLDHCTCGAAYLARRGRDPEPRPGEILHVTNGESAGNTLRQTGIGGAVLSWQDVLTEGPVPRLPPARLREVRARFLSECGWGSRRAILHGLERRDRIVADALAGRRHVVLWFEHDLYDQLQLLQILALTAEADHDEHPFELVNVDTFPGRPDFHGLGELGPEELESLWPLRRPVTARVVELGKRAWDAVCAPEPTAVEQFLAEDTAPLPFLAAALRRWLEELPAVGSGLARSERQLLEPLVLGPRTPVQLFHAAQEREEAPFDGDAWAWKRLAGLGGGERSLVSLADGGPLPTPPPLGDSREFAGARLVLTDLGAEVLAGRADRVDAVGIDRWLGGTQLRPGGVWRWDEQAGRVVSPPSAA
jgi:DNA-binding transcriptional MerR regulator